MLDFGILEDGCSDTIEDLTKTFIKWLTEKLENDEWRETIRASNSDHAANQRAALRKIIDFIFGCCHHKLGHCMKEMTVVLAKAACAVFNRKSDLVCSALKSIAKQLDLKNCKTAEVLLRR